MSDPIVLVPAPPVPAPKPVVPAGPRNLTTDDKFLLIDANHDGVNDTVIVVPAETAAEKTAKANLEKHAPYHAAVNFAREEAGKAHAGQSADAIALAKDQAEAKAKSEFKGVAPVSSVPVPAPSPVLVPAVYPVPVIVP
jgi:hypothetical protein